MRKKGLSKRGKKGSRQPDI